MLATARTRHWSAVTPSDSSPRRQCRRRLAGAAREASLVTTGCALQLTVLTPQRQLPNASLAAETLAW